MSAVRKNMAFLALCLFLLALIAVVYRQTVGYARGVSYTPWAFSEWLINYQGGFVRRGLGGELIRLLAHGDSGVSTVNALVFGTFVALVGLIGLLAFSARGPGSGLMLLIPFMPGGLWTMAINNEFYIRKEALFGACFAGLAVSYRFLLVIKPRALRHAALAVLLAVLLLLSIGFMLTNESFLFAPGAAFAVLVYAIAQDIKPDRAVAMAVAYVGVNVAFFLVACLFKGNHDVALGIWHSLGTADRSVIGDDMGALVALSWGLPHAVGMPISIVISGMAWYWLFAAAFSGLYCLLILSLDDPAARAGSVRIPGARAAVLIGLFLCSLPLFALGWDWGRWTSASILSFLIVEMAIEPECLQGLVSRFLPERWATAAWFIPLGRFGRGSLVASLLLVGLTFRLPECCISGSGRSTLQLLLTTIPIKTLPLFH